MLMQKSGDISTTKPVLPIPAGMPEVNALSDAFAVMGAAMRFEHNSEIFGEGEPSEYFYKVVRGAVRTYKLLNDGRRQISAFHLTGDIFGLEAGKEHRFTADAIADSTVLVIKRSALMALAARDSEIASGLWAQATGDLLRAQDHMLLLGRKNAHERVASFLLEMAERGSGPQSVELPMSRQDIADYLGLTIETVSRTLTLLENEAAIELPTSRRILLRDPAALRRLHA
jgi:CRP/FNR family transcriptional regulator, nitrogen fixation regulation protein